MMGNVLEIKNVSKSFNHVNAVSQVSLHCENGRIYGITGHNGSGKTVLLKCICGFLKYDEGDISVNGKKIGRDVSMLPNAGIIIEEPAFLRKWSGYRNLEYLYSIRNAPNRKYLCEVLDMVGLDPKLRKPVGKYSLGMKQRLAVAQAVMEEPEFLILDEPMNGLDKDGVAQMRALFLNLKENGVMMLLASHNREDIDVLCDEVYEMENGRMERIR